MDELRLKVRDRNDAYTKWLTTSKREFLVQFKERLHVWQERLSDRHRVHGSK